MSNDDAYIDQIHSLLSHITIILELEFVIAVLELNFVRN